MFRLFSRRIIPVASILVLVLCSADAFSRIRFKHHFGDRNLGGYAWGQTALTDVDRDGDLDFITGKRGGNIAWFEYRTADRWIRHILGRRSPSDVGGVAMDVDGDGSTDFVAGGVWYKNPRNPRAAEFQRHVFDKKLARVHDIIVGDVDGDRKPDVITHSQGGSLFRADVAPHYTPISSRNGLTGERQLSIKLNGPVLPIMPMGDYMPVRDRGG